MFDQSCLPSISTRVQSSKTKRSTGRPSFTWSNSVSCSHAGGWIKLLMMHMWVLSLPRRQTPQQGDPCMTQAFQSQHYSSFIHWSVTAYQEVEWSFWSESVKVAQCSREAFTMAGVRQGCVLALIVLSCVTGKGKISFPHLCVRWLLNILNV